VRKGLRALLITVGGGFIVFLLVVVFLAGLRSTRDVVVAAQAIPAGARLTADYLELKEIHSSSAMANALSEIEEAEGQVLTVARTEGDQITADMLGERATVGLATQLVEGHRAVAVHVNQASGLVGVVRPGDRVAVVAILDPQDAQLRQQMASYVAAPVTSFELGQTPTPAPTREPPTPAAYVVISGLRVLLVPQTFRYEEILPEEEEGGLAPARTSAAAQQDGVILLDIPTAPVEVCEGVEMSPAALLPLLDAKAELHLLLEPMEGDRIDVEVGANLGDLYRAMIGWNEPLTVNLPLTATWPLTQTTPLTATETEGEGE
jgi:Flp pilus assembly protein CpaB